MRHGLFARSTIVLLFVSLVAAQAVALAQETPSPAPPVTDRVGARSLGGGPPSATGDGLELVRWTFWPGGTLSERSAPGASVLHVESGRLGYRLIEGNAWVTRMLSGFESVPPTSSREQLTPGNVVLMAGDSVFAEAGVVYAAWNAGDAAVLVTVATVLRPDQPLPTIS